MSSHDHPIKEYDTKEDWDVNFVCHKGREENAKVIENVTKASGEKAIENIKVEVDVKGFLDGDELVNEVYLVVNDINQDKYQNDNLYKEVKKEGNIDDQINLEDEKVDPLFIDNFVSNSRIVTETFKEEKSDRKNNDYDNSEKNSTKEKIELGQKERNKLCPICGYTTNDLFNMTRHIKSVHQGVVYHCDIPGCDFETKQAGNIGGHKKVFHEGIRQSCRHCNQEFTSKHSLRIHESSQHLGVKFTCDKCEFTSATKSYLKTHNSVQHEGRRFHCKAPDCNFVCNDRSNLREHERGKHQHKLLKCRFQAVSESSETFVCQYQTYKRSELSKHKASVHTLSNEVDKLFCDQCNYQTSQRGHLTAHTKARHEGRKLVCDQCDYKTGFSGDLLRHKRTKHK